VVAPEGVGLGAETVAGRVAGVMVGHGGREHHIQLSGFRASLNLIAPIGMDFAGQINCKAHVFS